MSKTFLMADDFMAAMAAAGLVPELCTKLVITAEVGEAVTLEWWGFADQSALALAEVRKTTSPDQAKL